MSKELLLIATVPDLGAEGDVVTVADGFARNYLLPRKLAAPVTEGTRRQLAKMQKEREVKRKAEVGTARTIASALSQASVTLSAKTTGEGGHLYGSVGAADIVTALADQGIKLDKSAIELEHPIKELGCFDVKVKLHADVEASVKVWVVEE
jgi:large subunit ribosomal protein L9